MSAFHPLRTLHAHQALFRGNNSEDMIIHRLHQLASIELVASLAREETPASETVDLEASAARIFNEKTVFVRTHRPAPLRTIRQMDCASSGVASQGGA